MTALQLRCSACGAEHDGEASACLRCGGDLTRPCQACGTLNRPRQKFCGECGSLLRHATGRQPASAPVGTATGTPTSERKHVTVLFADIKGSLEILAERDPEDANRVLDNVLHCMMDAVHRYQGTVSQSRGDGIMALFGAPIAHEDHALRACFAAIRIQQSVAAYSEEALRTEGTPVHVRVGLNSGEVVVRSMQNDIYVEYTAVGHATHLANRMEQAAAPGTILATAQTARLVEGQVVVRPIGAIMVKGQATPVEACEIVAAGPARTRLKAWQSRLLSPFVGREAESRVLQQALQAARAGAGQMVVINGDAGVGKSRLVREFVERRGRGCLLMEVHPARIGNAVSLLPVIDMLRSYFGIAAGDAAAAVRKKTTAKLAERLPGMLEQIAPLLDVLEALPADHASRNDDAAQRRDAAIRAIAALMVGESRLQPVIGVFEDVQWNDSLTQDLLRHLATHLAGAPMLIVACHRPDHHPDWSQREGVQPLTLGALAPQDTAAMLEGILGHGADIGALGAPLHQRAGGNPFFVEEIVQSLIGSGVLVGSAGAYRRMQPLALTQIPDTVESLLASRIDRLSPADKQLLQEAAVIGVRVPHGLLQRLTGLPAAELRARLRRLEQRDFLSEDALYAELNYVFKHALTQEVAYHELLRERRRDIHGRIVRAMEEEFADRLDDVIGQLAHHALHGQLWSKAHGYLRTAGGRAADRHAYLEAVALYEQALQAIGHLPGSNELLREALDIRFDMRNALQPLGERSRMATLMQEAAELAKQLGDPGRVGWVQAYLTDHFWIRGLTREALEAGEQALRIGREQSDLALQVVTHLPLGLLHHTRGDYPLAMTHFGWNIAALKGALLHKRFGLFVLPSSFSRSFQAWALAELGEFAAAIEHAQRAIEIAEQAHDANSSGYAHLGLGVVHLRRGDLLNAVATLERALSNSGFADSPVGVAYVAFHLGYALVLAGRPADGLTMLQDTIRLAESKGFVARHSLRLAHLAEAYAVVGRLDEGTQLAQRAVELARQHDERANEAHALRAAGVVALRGGDPAAARGAFEAALALATALGMRPLQARCLRGLAQALGRRDPAAHAHAREAARLCRDMAMPAGGDLDDASAA